MSGHLFSVKVNLDKNGGIAQLGEHLPCKQGVIGSIPIISTMSVKLRLKCSAKNISICS